MPKENGDRRRLRILQDDDDDSGDDDYDEDSEDDTDGDDELDDALDDANEEEKKETHAPEFYKKNKMKLCSLNFNICSGDRCSLREKNTYELRIFNDSSPKNMFYIVNKNFTMGDK